MVDWMKQDREQRARLERNSSIGERADVCGMLNMVAGDHAGRELPGLGAYGVIRLLQNNGAAQARTARQHNRTFEKMLTTGALDRLHPDAEGRRGLRRAAAERSAGDDDARDEEYVPKREARRVRDADGSIRGGDGKQFADGDVRDAMEVLSVEDLRHIARARWRSRFF